MTGKRLALLALPSLLLALASPEARAADTAVTWSAGYYGQNEKTAANSRFSDESGIALRVGASHDFHTSGRLTLSGRGSVDLAMTGYDGEYTNGSSNGGIHVGSTEEVELRYAAGSVMPQLGLRHRWQQRSAGTSEQLWNSFYARPAVSYSWRTGAWHGTVTAGALLPLATFERAYWRSDNAAETLRPRGVATPFAEASVTPPGSSLEFGLFYEEEKWRASERVTRSFQGGYGEFMYQPQTVVRTIGFAITHRFDF